MRLAGIRCLLLLIGAATVAHCQSDKALTNQGVVQMVKGGFDDQTVIKAIQANKTNFDVSPQALLALKSDGLSQTVIQAMLTRTTAEKKEANAPTAPSANGGTSSAPAGKLNDPLSPHPPGIYWERSATPGLSLVDLEASPYASSKTSGLFGSAMTMGLSKTKIKILVSGGRANLHVPESKPEFWFYFVSGGSAFSSGPSRPEDFILVKLETHGSDRELVVGKAGAFSASSGVPSEDTLAIESKQAAPGIYEVHSAEPLDPGQYAFVPANLDLASKSGGKLFDFEVDAAR